MHGRTRWQTWRSDGHGTPGWATSSRSSSLPCTGFAEQGLGLSGAQVRLEPWDPGTWTATVRAHHFQARGGAVAALEQMDLAERAWLAARRDSRVGGLLAVILTSLLITVWVFAEVTGTFTDEERTVLYTGLGVASAATLPAYFVLLCVGASKASSLRLLHPGVRPATTRRRVG